MKGSDNLCVNFFYHWENDEETKFRKIELHIDFNIIKEFDKFEAWTGNYRTCCTCKEEFPECLYFFNSGGKNSFHKRCKRCDGSSSYGWGRLTNKELNKINKHYCSKCDKILDLNILYFSKTNGRCNKTGYSSNCKECIGLGFGIKHLTGNKDIVDVKDGFKLCNMCHLELPDNCVYFFEKNGRENGSCTCKKCRNFKYGGVVHSVTFPEGHRCCSKCQKLFIFKSNNQYYCPDCEKELRREYHNKPEVKESKRLFTQKRRAKKKGLRDDLTIDQYEETLEYFDCSCVYCGKSEDENFKQSGRALHQDHVVPLSKNGEYTKSNIVPACDSCNKSKGNKDLEEFYEFKESFTQKKYEKLLEFIELNS